MKRFVKVSDFVYWVECDGFEKGKPIYSVHSGYYLASYTIGKTTKHIVSRNSVTSCVVIHLKEDEMFYREEKEFEKLKGLKNGDKT